MNKQIRQQVYEMFSGHCAYCGCEIEQKDMQVDHIVPLLRWDTQEQLDKWYGGRVVKGADDISNYYPSCRACNIRKGTLDIEHFRSELETCHKRMMKFNANYRQLVRFGQIQLVDNGKVKFYFEKVSESNYGEFAIIEKGENK